MWNFESESASVSPLTQAKSSTAGGDHAAAEGRHGVSPDAPPAGVGGGGGAGTGSIDDISAVMSHWADAQQEHRDQRAIKGLGGASAHSDAGESPQAHDYSEYEGGCHDADGHAAGEGRVANNERALPGIVQSVGKSFGYDFSDVSFLKGMPPVATAHGAKAVASGTNEVALDLNTMDLHDPEGQKILGSELAHIMQKRQGTIEPDAVDAHIEGHAAKGLAAHAEHDQKRRDHLEHEADAAGEKAARGAPVSIGSGARVPKNQFWGLGDVWNKAKETASGVVDTAQKGAAWVGDKAEKGAAWVGDKVAKGASWATDKVSKGASWVGDKVDKGASWLGDKVDKGASWLGDKVDKGASWVGDKADKGASWATDKVSKGASWATDKVSKGAAWLGDKINKGVDWAGDKIKRGASWVGDKVSKGASWVGDKAKKGASWALDKMKKGASWLGEKGKQLYDGVKKKVVQTTDDMKKGMKQEGVWGFLKDPIGALDRQQAQRELSDRFQVVPDNFQGPRAPNAVSQAEYERICHTYSDIRLGRGDLTIDAGAKDSNSGGQLKTKEAQENYRQGALRDIVAMMQTQSGRREIEQLHNNVPRDENGVERHGFFGMQMPFNLGPALHRHTTVVPLLNKDGTPDQTNGYAAPDGDGSTRQVNADGTLGKNGSGSDVHIRYNPGVNIGDVRPGMSAANPWMRQFRSDILLAHEMNHAIKQTTGTGDPTAVQAPDNAANATDSGVGIDAKYRDSNGNPLRRIEHQAVGLGKYKDDDMTENAYRRERRQLAQMGGVGKIESRVGKADGDADLVERDTYVGRSAPAAPAPAPGPASPGVLPEPTFPPQEE